MKIVSVEGVVEIGCSQFKVIVGRDELYVDSGKVEAVCFEHISERGTLLSSCVLPIEVLRQASRLWMEKD